MVDMEKWMLYPFCYNKTRNRIREDTVLINMLSEMQARNLDRSTTTEYINYQRA